VSTDASLFPVHFFDSNIYCEKCRQLKKFKVFSQEKYDKHYGKSEIPPNKPLFCKCEKCESHVIYATNEFAELQEEPMRGFCKIWGMGNLEAGDLVFHPEEHLCTVDSVVFGASPYVTLVNQNRKKIDFPIDNFSSENSSVAFYRLFPQNFQNARIGDFIYHTGTGLVSNVIGLRFNGEQTIIVISENGEIEFCGCGDNTYYLTDNILEKNTKWRCRDLKYCQYLQIHSISKVLYINCIVTNFSAVCEFEKIISSIPQARCFIMHIAVEKCEIKPKSIYMELLRNGIYICCCHVEIENQDVYISGFYSSKNTPKDIYKTLSKFPVKKVNLDIKMRSNIKLIKTINEDHCFIKITKIEKETHIDGWAKNEKIKKRAKLKAFLCTFSLKIENHLQVIND